MMASLKLVFLPVRPGKLCWSTYSETQYYDRKAVQLPDARITFRNVLFFERQFLHCETINVHIEMRGTVGDFHWQRR